jgi:hypothetical protein
MKTMILGKRNTQILLRRIRQAGHIVKRIGKSGYEIYHDGDRIFKAMIGHRGYLISYSPDLITHLEIIYLNGRR